MAKIVFFGNYKGGVGKTTSVFYVARYLCENYNKRILLLDLDPQSSLSDICIKHYEGSANANIKQNVPDNRCLNYVYDLYTRKIEKYPSLELEFDIQQMVYQKGNLCFVPSKLYYPNDAMAENKLGLDELSMKMQDTVEYMGILKHFIDNVDKNYKFKNDDNENFGQKFDYIFIDCPPANNIITKGAFLAADYFTIPTILDGVSTNGVIHYIETVVGTYKKYCNNVEDAIIYKYLFGDIPKLVGIFYTFIRQQASYSVDRVNFIKSLGDAKDAANNRGDEETKRLLNEIYIFNKKIDNYVTIARNITAGDLPQSNDYKEFTDEFLKRLEEI